MPTILVAQSPPPPPPSYATTADINHGGVAPIASSTHCPDCVTNNILATIFYRLL